MTEPSWRAKLLRAEHHFGYLKARIGSLPPQKYAVSKGFETYQGVEQWVWRIDIPPIDPALAIVVGDVLFNVRSALDHLAIALIPPAGRTRHVLFNAQFPIFTCDIDERDPFTGTHMHRQQRRRWDRQTQGLTDKAETAIKWHQPYQFIAQGNDPRDSSLAILSALQNADKHRQLVLVTRGLANPTATWTHPSGASASYEGPPLVNSFLGDGTVVDSDPVDIYGDMKMEVEGTPEVFIGESWDGPYRHATLCLRLILASGWQCIERLESLVAE